MSAPLCHYCAAESMKLVISFPLPGLNAPEGPKVALYQCDQCKRVTAQVE